MTFGKWLIVGLEVAFFTMGCIAAGITHDPAALVIGGVAMMFVAIGYAIGATDGHF